MTSYLHNIVRRGALSLVGPKAANSPIEPSRRFEQTIEPEAHTFKTARPAPPAPDEAEHLSETVDSPIKPGLPDQTDDQDIHGFAEKAALEAEEKHQLLPEFLSKADIHLPEASHYASRPTDGIASPEPTDTAQHQTSYVVKKPGEPSTSSVEELTVQPPAEFAARPPRLTPTLKSGDDMRELISEPPQTSETYAVEPAAPFPNAGPQTSESLEGQRLVVPPHEQADSNPLLQIGVEPLNPQADVDAPLRPQKNEIDTTYLKVPGSLYGQQSFMTDSIQDKPGQTSTSGSINLDGHRPQFETEVVSSAKSSRLPSQAEQPKPTAITFPGLGSASKGRGPVGLEEVADATDRRLAETDRSGLDLAKERGHASEISREAIRPQADLIPGKTREKLAVAAAIATPSPRVDSEPKLKINSLEIKIVNDVRDRPVRSEAQKFSTRISREPSSMLERHYHRHFDLIY